MTKTVDGDRLRAQAAQHERDAIESWERSDTDGFLSQWASGINAQLDRANADIADNGGVVQFERLVLQRLDGSVVEDARQINTRYGLKWRSDAEDIWLPYRPRRESTLAKRGYREATETETGPAKAITWSSTPNARGLSGAANVFVKTIRTDRPKSEGWRFVGFSEEAEA